MNIGIIEYVNHGTIILTTTITMALAIMCGYTAKKYDRINIAPKEKTRSIMINIIHVEYETSLQHYVHIDCPDHVDYVRNMITNANNIRRRWTYATNKGTYLRCPSSFMQYCRIKHSPIVQDSPLLHPVGIWAISQSQCG